MENIKLNIEKTLGFISKEKLASYEPKVRACMETGCTCLLLLLKNT